MPASRAQQAFTAERRTKAIAMRIAGTDWDVIKEKLGYASRGAAITDVRRALDKRTAELNLATDELRELELMKLDRYLVKVEEVLERRHVTVNNGKVIYYGDEPLLDDEPILRAVKTALDIQASRAKLTGLNMAQQIEQRITTIDPAEAEFREHMAQQRALRQAARDQEAQPNDPAPAADP